MSSTSTSHLIFPSAASNFSSTLNSLKRSTLSIPNRLRSIISDAEFVCALSSSYGLPLIANERCGSWYIPPDRKVGSAYFKSTDGHMGQWAFSLRRLNLDLLGILGDAKGGIIVDSTRRGKVMPDALSKTVPIWCAVLNRALFPENVDAHALYTPPDAVSRSEHSQIEERLNGFARQFLELKLDLTRLREQVKEPLRPMWVTRDSFLQNESLQNGSVRLEGFVPVVLCTASKHIKGWEGSEGGYIQGAGDDSEGWARGLTPPVFWKYREELMGCPETELPDRIAQYVAEEAKWKPAGGRFSLVSPTTQVFIGLKQSAMELEFGPSDLLIDCGSKPLEFASSKLKSRYLHLSCRQGKLGSRDLRSQLPKLPAFLRSKSNFNHLYISCPTGKDLSAGVALAVLCLFTDDNAQMVGLQGASPSTKLRQSFTKQYIRQKLSWIMTSVPSASPSRTTLQSINDFVL
ncbi:initiator tRNA phosphoribosyl transferase, partial [Microthyrium microscopicum]